MIDTGKKVQYTNVHNGVPTMVYLSTDTVCITVACYGGLSD